MNENNNERTILVTNDDGIYAKGIHQLIEAAKAFGKVVVVAPSKPQSAMGHAITIHKPLRVVPVDFFDGVEAYACSGTPVDCVKIAVDKILHRKPDLCVSGINHGSNSSINIIYSGTLSAAMEAALEGIPAIGFSLLDYRSTADMTAAGTIAQQVIDKVLHFAMPAHHLLNVNIPNLPLDQIKGIRICRQAEAHWDEHYDERTDPQGGRYFWLTGKFIVEDEGTDTDEYALKNGYVSVVPVQYDLTAHEDISRLQAAWQLETYIDV